jgi:hypothetical protein
MIIYEELKDTVDLMLSNDYEDRFRAEYYQTLIRYDKLRIMLDKWDKGELDFEPSCSKNTLLRQKYEMKHYLDALVIRANEEEIPIF